MGFIKKRKGATQVHKYTRETPNKKKKKYLENHEIQHQVKNVFMHKHTRCIQLQADSTKQNLDPSLTIRRIYTKMNRNTRYLLAATSLSISLVLNLLPYSSCTNIINDTLSNETIVNGTFSLPPHKWFVPMCFHESTDQHK